jgi:ketosteroid isomerase-like protein
MRTIALAIALVVGLILPAFAQKAEIEAVNAKWIDFFKKGDFAGVASLYTDDATAFHRVPAAFARRRGDRMM